MPPIHQLLMPAVVVVGAWLVISRFSWKDYPALISWMSLAVFVQTLTYKAPYPAWMAVACCAFLAAAVSEVARCSRFNAKRKWRVMAAAFVLAACGALQAIGLTWAQRGFLFRSYFLLEAFGALAVMTVYRLWHPVLECRRHQVYRIGMTLWVGVSAAAGIFVRGGIGYRIWPWTPSRYAAIGSFTYWAMMATVAGMCAAMWASAPGRKHAAKKPDGKTVTGQIDQMRAA